MRYWLMKSEPGEFSIDDLASRPERTEHWDGIRNYQARNFMRDEMEKDDRALFYHSSCDEPAIVGIVRITREAYPDHTAFDPGDRHFDPKSDPYDPRWLMVDVTLERKMRRPITLIEMREHAQRELKNFLLLKRGNRLSIFPVDKKHWDFILSLESKSV